MRHTLLFGGILIALLAPLPAPASAQHAPPVNPYAATIGEFMKRVDAYAALHKKLESTLPPLAKQTTPQEMDGHERALAKLIQAARSDAKPGDIFGPGMPSFVRKVLAPVFIGRAGTQIKSEITDNEYKGDVKLAVNGRYPDDVPVSTMPPQVLKALPKLPPELEYRFVLTTLILFDPRAHVIPDFVEQAFK
jgi:hypothetical protein